jgi:hypothetical protein
MASTPPAQSRLSGTVYWADRITLFDGYVLLGLVLPTLSGSSYVQASVVNTYPAVQIPLWTKVPIKLGTFSNQVWVWQNSAIDPPGTAYVSYWYDLNDRPVGQNIVSFTIAVDPYPIVVPSLTLPTPGTGFPVPDQPPTGAPYTLQVIAYPEEETPAGTINGVNNTFTLSKTPNFVMVKLNGVVLTQGIGYTLSGATLTMLPGYIPQPGDSLRCVVF